MARIRSIKPEFCTSEQVVSCSRDARLMFITMWPFCDDNGVHPASPRRLKMEVFPGDDDIDSTSVRRLVDELLSQGLLEEYEVDGERYWRVTGWRHQKIDRPTAKYPLHPAISSHDHHHDTTCDNSSTMTRGGLDECSSNDHSGLDDRSPPERKGGEGIGEERKGGESESANDQIVAIFPAKDNTEWHLRQSKVNEYKRTYPKLDVDAEMRKARQWVVDNPSRQKKPGGMTRYLGNWLSIAEEDRKTAANKSADAKPSQSNDDDFHEQLKRQTAARQAERAAMNGHA